MVFSNVTWLWAQDPLILFISQCFTGFVWAGYELSTFTFLLQATKPSERSRISSYLNIVVALAGFVGGMLGAWLVVSGPQPVHPFFLVFLVSAVLRLISYLVFGPKLKQVVELTPVSAREVLLKASGFKTAWGMTQRLIILRLPFRRKKPKGRPTSDDESQKSS
jgi:MFS family permease